MLCMCQFSTWFSPERLGKAEERKRPNVMLHFQDTSRFPSHFPSHICAFGRTYLTTAVLYGPPSLRGQYLSRNANCRSDSYAVLLVLVVRGVRSLPEVKLAVIQTRTSPVPGKGGIGTKRKGPRTLWLRPGPRLTPGRL